MSGCLNPPSPRRATWRELRSHLPVPLHSWVLSERSLCMDMTPNVSADALTKPYNSASAEMRATTACVLHHIFNEEILQLCILLWCCGVFFCNLHNLYLSTFQVGTAFLETRTTIELWVCFSNTSPTSPLLPVCCCWSCHVTCQFFCAVHDVSSVDGKKVGSCCQCSTPSGSGRAQNLSDQGFS